MEKLGSRFGKGRGVATRRRRGRRARACSRSSSRRRGSCDDGASRRLASPGARDPDRRPVRRPRQPARARGRPRPIRRGEAGRGARRRRPRPQRPGPRGAGRCAALAGGRRRADRRRATRTSRSRTSTTGRRSRSTHDGVPDTVRERGRVGPRRARRRAAGLAPPPAVGAPAARRGRHARSSSVHASPGSQTRGFDQALDPNVILERSLRTDARVIAVGHTHVPEVRDLGWKVIVNAGSAGYVFDGDPTASWALIDIDDDGEVGRADPADRVRRPGRRQRDLGPRPARATSIARPPSAPGSWSDELVLAGAAATRRRHRDGHGHRARQRRRLHLGRPRRRPLRASADRELRPVAADRAGSPARSRTSTRSGVLDRKELRRTDRYIQFGLVAPARRWTRPACRGAWRATSRKRPA